RNTNRNVWVRVGAIHATRHFAMYILLKRVRTAFTMFSERRVPSPFCSMLKKPPIWGFAKFCMNSNELFENSSHVRVGMYTLITGTGVLGSARLSSGKRPLDM